MDLIEKYLGEKTDHNNPYVGRWFKKPILYFNVPNPNSNVDTLYVWTGKKWMPMDNVNNPDRYTYDQKDAALELIRNAVPNLKKRIKRQNPEWESYIKGW